MTWRGLMCRLACALLLLDWRKESCVVLAAGPFRGWTPRKAAIQCVGKMWRVGLG